MRWNIPALPEASGTAAAESGQYCEIIKKRARGTVSGHSVGTAGLCYGERSIKTMSLLSVQPYDRRFYEENLADFLPDTFKVVRGGITV